MKGLIRTGVIAILGVIAYFIAGALGINPIFWVAPLILSLVHTVLWDLLKLDALDNGFFKFIKFVVLVAFTIVLTIWVAPTSSNMITAEFFSIEAPYTDIQIISTTGAIAMMSATFLMCLICMESFGNRFVGLSVPFVGIGFGLLYGLLVYFLGAISPDFSRILAWAILIFAAFGLINYIKKNGLLYADLDKDAKFQGFGIKSGGGGKKFRKTGRPVDDAMNYIASRESKFVDLYYNNKLNIEVSVYVFTTAIEFTIDAKIYNNNPNMSASQISEVANQVNNILQNAQSRIMSSAKRDVSTILNNNPSHYNANIGYDISVKIGDIRQ